MGEMGEVFNVMKQVKKERHSIWYDKNLEIIKSYPYIFTQHETVLLFREKNKPKVDFYLHTGRWKSLNKTHRGGAKAFIEWYRSS